MSAAKESDPAGAAGSSSPPGGEAWGIDVGGTALRALKIASEGGDAFSALDCDVVEYARPAADPSLAVREALGVFLEHRDLRGARVAVGMPGRGALVTVLSVPPVDPGQIPQVVAIEAKQQLPVPLEELAWDYQPIESAGAGPLSMFMAAARRELVEAALRPFREAGVEVDLLQMEPLALANFATADRTDRDEGGASPVLIDIGARGSVAVFVDGARLWPREIPVGGDHFTAALAERAKLTPEKAEAAKRHPDRLRDPRALLSVLRGVLDEFADHIGRTLEFYRGVSGRQGPFSITLVGNGAKLVGLPGFLRLRLGCEVEKLGGFARLRGDEVEADARFRDELPSFGVAYGLAVQALGRGRFRTNLLPPELRRRQGGLFGRLGRLWGGR